jgi:hypothetical protein
MRPAARAPQRVRQLPPGGDGAAEVVAAAHAARHRLPGGHLHQALLQFARAALEALLLPGAHAFAREHGAVGIGLRREAAGAGDHLRQALAAADVVGARAEELAGQGDGPGVAVGEAARQPHRVARRQAHGGEVARAEVEREPRQGQGARVLRRLARQLHRRQVRSYVAAAPHGFREG